MFPCRHAPDKSPLTRRGFKDASRDTSRVHGFWSANPGASIGVPAGERSGFFVLDADRMGALDELPGELPETLTVGTPRGGRHVYFRHAEGVTNSTGALPEGLDVRGEGGYVVVPPSPGYTVERRAKIAEAPGWLLELVREKPKLGVEGSRSRDRVGAGEIPRGEPIPEGMRNQTLFYRALDLKDGRLGRGEILDRLLTENATRCSPPLEEAEVEKIAKSAIRYPIRSGSPTPEVVEAVEALEEHWWERPWPGVGGKTDRDVYRVLIELARRYGRLEDDGSVAVSGSVRSVAPAAATTFVTVSRGATKRLAAAGLTRKVDAGRGAAEAATWVLLPQASPPVNTQASAATEEEMPCVNNQLRSRLWELETPAFRWSGLVKKGRAGVLYALEACGQMGLAELAEAMGWGNRRELKRRYVLPLVELGLVEERDGIYALHGDHTERVEEVRGTRYATVGRRRRESRDGERKIRWVEETRHEASEVERDERDLRTHEEQRQGFRLHLAKTSPEAEGECRELLNAWDEERRADGEISELDRVEESDPDANLTVLPFGDLGMLYSLIGSRVLTDEGPGMLWQARSDQVGVVLDDRPGVVTWLPPAAVLEGEAA